MGKTISITPGKRSYHLPPKGVDQPEERQKNNHFSLQVSTFTPGYINKEDKAVPQVIPFGYSDLVQLKEYITTSEYAKKVTEELCNIKDHDLNSRFKTLMFSAVTFSGLFTYRNAKGRVVDSGLMVLDFDFIDLIKVCPDGNIKAFIRLLRKMFIEDKLLCTVMFFFSPNGNGFKAVVYVGDKQGLFHKDAFTAISEYIYHKYGIETDKSGSNVDRICYVPSDKECYLRDLTTIFAPAINLWAWLEEQKQRCAYRWSSMSGSLTCSNADDVFALVEKFVSRHTVYVEGSRNRYISSCGYLLCNFGVDEAEAEEWAVQRFADFSGNEIRSTFKSCYRNTQFGVKTIIKK